MPRQVVAAILTACPAPREASCAHPDPGPAAPGLHQLDHAGTGHRAAGGACRHRTAAVHAGALRAGRSTPCTTRALPGLSAAESRVRRDLLAAVRLGRAPAGP